MRRISSRRRCTRSRTASGESLTLRPEATASLLRAYIEHGLHVQPKPVRLYTLGPMFRYERPQAGRYRQFHQANVEALGETHPALDAEVIAMLMDFFRALGLADRLELHVNSIGDAGTRPRLRRAAGGLPHAARAAGSARSAGRGWDGIRCGCSTARCPSCQPIIEKAPSILDSLSARGGEATSSSVRGCLDAMGDQLHGRLRGSCGGSTTTCARPSR